MKRSRAYRRHHRTRWVNRVKKYSYLQYLRENRWWRNPLSEEEIQSRIAFHATTRSPCSCWACGNPRTTGASEFPHGETKQEYLSEIDFKEQIRELQDERKDSDNI